MSVTPPVMTQEKINQIHREVCAVAVGVERLLNVHNQAVVYNCSVCEGSIYSGNACVDVTRRVEQVQSVDGRSSITVIDADVLATFCADCGNLFAYAQHWRKNLRLTLGLSNDNDLIAADPLICDQCLGVLETSGARVVVLVMISQVDRDSGEDGRIVHTPICDEIFLHFCPECGNHMSRERLGRAVVELLQPEIDLAQKTNG